AESYLEVGSNRNSFQNARTVTAHPDFGPAPKNVMLVQYVQKITPEIIEPIRRELFKRAEILTGARRTGDTGLRIEINGQIIHSQIARKKKGLYRFELPADLRGDLRILSNAAVVRETSLIDRTDTRVIGVGLAGVALITNDQRYEIDLSDSTLGGLNEAQEMDGVPMRWTTSESIIPTGLMPTLRGPMVLELNVLRTHMYWTSAEQQKTRKAA
ncbi:MAG: Hint domain-containing protein, partial [Advenella sp.]